MIGTNRTDGSKANGSTVAAPLSLPRRSGAKAGRGAPTENGDSERIREQAPRRDYSPSGIHEVADGRMAMEIMKKRGEVQLDIFTHF